MDINNRRQHVDRIVAGLGESGSHIPNTSQAEDLPPTNSFTLTSPPPDSNMPVYEDTEFHIPKGPPSLFEEAPVEISDDRLEQPSPLDPQAVSHLSSSTEASPGASLEDKFVQAINIPEAAANHEKPVDTAQIEPEALQTPVHPSQTNSDPAGQEASPPAQADARSEHFTTNSQSDSSHGVEDAGFAAAAMAQRLSLKTQEQKAG